MKQLTSIGHKLDMSANAFAELRDSSPVVHDTEELQARMAADGYLFLRNFFDRERVLNGRKQVIDWLSATGQLHPDFPAEKAIAAPGTAIGATPENHLFPNVRSLTHSGKIIDFYDRFFGDKTRVYDYLWMRLMSPDDVTGPHYDSVYLGRGTPRVYTTWVPLGDVPMEHGALMILEKSHQLEELKRTYGKMDIDKNRNWRKIRFRHRKFFRGGDYSRNPPAVQKQFGLRWLTTDFRAGDVLIFPAFTMHGSLDNTTPAFRISADARYQLASEPVDERWIGENPIAHSQAE